MRVHIYLGVGVFASTPSSPTFFTSSFGFTTLFLFFVWFNFLLPFSFETGAYHLSIVTGFQLTDVYTWLMFWLVWIIECHRKFVSPTVVNAVLSSF